jgi:hypothetical protein
VHICLPNREKIWSVTVADGKTVVVDLAKELGTEEKPVAITHGPKDVLWVATQHAVWQWRPAEGKMEKKATITGDTIEDIAWNPVSDTLFMSGRFGEGNPVDGFLALRPGEKEAVEVKLSLTPLFAPAFDKEGRMFFRYQDDLWVGGEVSDGDDVEMSAFRVAPLAQLMSESGELGGSKIITGIAPIEKSVYLVLQNKVEAELVKLPKPAKVDPTEPLKGQPGELKASWKKMAATLQGAEVVPFPGDVADISALCVSPDGARVFFLMLSDNDGSKKFKVLETKTGKVKVVGEFAE